MNEEIRIVDDVPTSPRVNEEVVHWRAMAKMAVQASPKWLEIPNINRAHAHQIKYGYKTAFNEYPGQWETKTRKREGDDGNRATLYVRYLP